ncbi:MAG: hypothetical protein IT168_09270 [Bryobacterales bacterium]|nr:hypothetical protein [Bryobacterales bacterium]
MKSVIALLALSVVAFGQYKVEPAGAPPSELAAAMTAELQPAGHKVTSPDGKVWCEVWFRKEAPTGPPTSESDVTWKTMPPGSLVGAIRFPGNGIDRRGQPIKAGVYTLRFSMFPINGDHQGVAPQRDFLVLTPAAGDQDPKQIAKFDDLMAMSRKASGTPHPAILSMWLIEGDFQPGLEQMGEHDWVLKAAVGKSHIALIVVGKAEG